MERTEGEKICGVCLAEDTRDLVEPVTTPCGHLLCWPCLYRAVQSSRKKECPVCKAHVESVMPLYILGQPRRLGLTDVPSRPVQGADPFSSLNFTEPPPRRSGRARAPSSRLIDYDTSSNTGNSALPRSRSHNPSLPDGPELTNANEGNTVSGLIDSQQSAEGEDFIADFSDDEDLEERARQEFEAENAEHLRLPGITPPTPRFMIRQPVPGADGQMIHLDIVVSEVENQMITNQCKINDLNWMQVARNIRQSYPRSFPGSDGTTLKDTKSVARISKNSIRKAIKKFKKKCEVMNRTGNSGPPDSPLDVILRSIITLDESVPGNSRRLAPRGRLGTRPVMLDPQPIVSASNSHRVASAEERDAAASILNLDLPRTGSYRQQRRSLASQGQELRENSLAEQQSRRNRSSTTELRATGASVMAGAATNALTLGSERKTVEMIVLNNMEIRRDERERDREERRILAEKEKEEREARAKIEREEREYKAKLEREERDVKDRRERDERETRDILLFGYLGINKIKKRQIKVQAVSDSFGSQQLAVKLNLTSLSELIKDLNGYMCEEAEGIVLQEAGEKVIVTSVESIVEKGCESFSVSKLEKRGKVYFSLAEA